MELVASSRGANAPLEPMRAATRTRYGSAEVVSVRTVPAPRPGRGEVRIRVQASSVNAADWFMVRGRPWVVRAICGWWRPSHAVFGRDVAGIVDAVGPGVTRFRPGDRVFGEIDRALAELVCGPEDQLARIPDDVSWVDAAAVPLAGTTAWQGLRECARVEAGHHVCVVGASGGVGTFAVQIARAFGAEVTAVCHGRSTARLLALGATRVIDRTRDDYTRAGYTYDIVFDLGGCAPLRAALRCLGRGGVYVSSVGRLGRTLQSFVASTLPGSRVKVLVARASGESLRALAELLADRRVAPAIDRVYALDEVREALRRQSEGRGRGKTVVAIAPALQPPGP